MHIYAKKTKKNCYLSTINKKLFFKLKFSFRQKLYEIIFSDTKVQVQIIRIFSPSYFTKTESSL